MSAKQRVGGYAVFIGELVFLGVCMFLVMRYMP
jgi:hypothetical protein